MYHIVRQLLFIQGQAFEGTSAFAGIALATEMSCWKHNNLYNSVIPCLYVFVQGHSCVTVHDGDHVFAFYKMGV